jgi:hypothetical protein
VVVVVAMVVVVVGRVVVVVVVLVVLVVVVLVLVVVVVPGAPQPLAAPTDGACSANVSVFRVPPLPFGHRCMEWAAESPPPFSSTWG